MISTTRRRGKPRREEMQLPANIQRAFIARASGANWIQCAEIGNTSTANLRKWREHPDANSYIQEAIESNLGESHSKFADAAPALAGQSIGLINEVLPVEQIIKQTMQEFNSVCESLSNSKFEL